MSWKLQTAIVGIIALLLAVLGFIIYQQQKLIQEMSQTSSEIKRLKEGITTPSIQTKTEKEVIREVAAAGFDPKALQAELDKIGAELKGLQTIIASSRGKNVTETKSDNVAVTPGPVCKDNVCIDTFGTLSGVHSLKLSEPFANKEIPIGEVKFTPGKELPWGYQIYPRQYVVHNVLSYDKDDNVGLMTSFKVKSNNKEYQIDVDVNSLSRVYPKEGISFGIYPFIGLFGGAVFGEGSEVKGGGNVGAHVLSYGRTRRTASFRFLGLAGGLSTTRSAELQIIPISYNVGNILPVVENLWVSPAVGVETSGRATVAAVVSIGL